MEPSIKDVGNFEGKRLQLVEMGQNWQIADLFNREGSIWGRVGVKMAKKLPPSLMDGLYVEENWRFFLRDGRSSSSHCMRSTIA